MNTRLVITVCAIFWGVALVAGGGALLRYEYTPGSTAATPVQWPADSRISRPAGRAALVVFVHPQCPCSRATIGELATIMAQSQGKLTASVLFHRPAGAPAEWEQTGLWTDARAIPGVQVLSDSDGQEARRFGAETSGHAVLYNAAGELAFSGGITASRGHAGDNAGQSAIVEIANGGATRHDSTFVFGCSLLNPAIGSARPPRCPSASAHTTQL